MANSPMPLLLIIVVNGTICAIVPRVTSLAAYVVKIWNLNDREHESVSDFDGEGTDLFAFLHDVLNGIKTKTIDQEQLQQAFSVTKLEKKERTLRGLILTGQYGHESDFIDVKTAKTVYKRKKNDAEMLPFYFHFEIPEGVEDGILILQRTATFGIRKLLYWVLKTAFEDAYPEFKLKVSPLVAESEVDKFIKGKIQKIHFIKKDIPSDVTDAWDKGHNEVKGTLELVIRANKGSILPMNDWLSKLFKNKKVGGIFVFDEKEDFAYDNVKAQVKLGHATRTINAANPGRIRSYFDITDSVKIGSNGQPQYNSIQEQAEALAEHLRGVLYGSGAA
jgi:hypothetical protein